ncbi:MAG: ABC transporter ATP-binding protein [Geminicoccaceae bacterium]
MDSDTPIISLRDVHLTFEGPSGPVNVLAGIDLDVAPGSSVGIVGPSGSGKTSLISLVAGIERPTRGEITVAGRRLGTLDADGLAQLRRDTIAVLFQSFHLIPTMTAIENVALPRELKGASDGDDRARRHLAEVGLGDREGHYPSQLSGGEQQRVALARALAADPEILLADEPTGNLDGNNKEAVASLMLDLCRTRGTTLLLVTHDLSLAERCAEQVTMRAGRLASSPAKAAA